MNLKTILTGSLVVTIAISVLVYAFFVYTVFNDATNKTGKDMVVNHQLLLYGQLVTHIIAFGLSVMVLYKR